MFGFIKLMFKPKCSHVFVGVDIERRDYETGLVSWPCSKCGQVFSENCGIDIGKNGKITGPW